MTWKDEAMPDYPTDEAAQDATEEYDTGTLFWLPVILRTLSLDPTETLLLVAMANHIDADDMCFVGMAKLAAYGRVSYGTVRRRLRNLETRGVIHRERLRRTDGNLSVYEYRLQRKAFGLPARNLRDDQRAPRRAMISAHPDARAEPLSNEPPSVEELFAREPGLSSDKRTADAAFVAWYAVYPLKSAKAEARAAFSKALSKTSLEELIAGAERYRDDPNRDPAYTKQPGTWLNKGCWDDDPLPERRTNGATTGNGYRMSESGRMRE